MQGPKREAVETSVNADPTQVPGSRNVVVIQSSYDKENTFGPLRQVSRHLRQQGTGDQVPRFTQLSTACLAVYCGMLRVFKVMELVTTPDS